MYQIPQTYSSNAALAPRDRYSWLLRLGWFLIFVMVLRTGFFIRGRYVGAYDRVSSYNLVNIIVTVAIAAILAIKWQEVVFAIRKGGAVIGCVICYYLVSGVSGLRSPSPAYAAFRAFEFLAFFLFIMLLLRRSDGFFRAEQLALIWMTLGLLADFGGGIRVGGWGVFHTNRYTVTAAMLFGYSFAELASASGRRRLLLLASSALGLGGVLLGTSTGSNLALAGGLVILLVRSPRHRRYLLIIAPVLLLVVNWNQLLDVALGGKSLEEVLNLKHRWDIWMGSWNLFVQRPLLGYGLNVAAREYASALSSHNAYLEALLGGGVLGAGVLFCGCLALLYNLWRSTRKRTVGSLGCCVAIVVYLINGMSAPTIGCVVTAYNIVFAFVLALFIYHVRCLAGSDVEPLHIPSPQWSQISRLRVYGRTAEPSAEVS